MTEFVYNDSELQFNSKLILCIEECDELTDENLIDTRVFIGWNHMSKDYFIFGKRQDTSNSAYVPFFFHCTKAQNLYDFVWGIIDMDNTVTVTLYNYNNITAEQNLSYEFFENNMDPNYEIIAFDDVNTVKKKSILKYLSMLRHMYTYEQE